MGQLAMRLNSHLITRCRLPFHVPKKNAVFFPAKTTRLIAPVAGQRQVPCRRRRQRRREAL
jgi:hypothetical protein